MKRVSLIIICSLVLFGVNAQKKKIFYGKNLHGWKVHVTEIWYVEE